MDAADDCRILQRRAVAKAAIERVLEQLLFIEIGEHLGNRLTRNLARDTKRFDLPDDARPPVMAHAHFGAGTRERRAPVVEGTLRPQTRDCHIDVVLREFASAQSHAQLRFRKLAAGEKRQADDVGPLGAVGHQRVPGFMGDPHPPKRVISGTPPD